MLVENAVLVEMKAVRSLDSIHAAQCLNYLKATGLSLCLLLNFGNQRLNIRRLVNCLRSSPYSAAATATRPRAIRSTISAAIRQATPLARKAGI
jgi:hypothetical protein